MTQPPAIKSLPLSDAYRSAIVTAIVLQIPLTLLLRVILDLGVLAKVGGCAMAGFWLGAAVIMIRRPLDPKPSDLAYIRWGYPFMLAAGIVIAALRNAE
jgi:hypothetical protein